MWMWPLDSGIPSMLDFEATALAVKNRSRLDACEGTCGVYIYGDRGVAGRGMRR